MIQFLGVSKTYKPVDSDPVVALDNVSFEINEGEFVFIVGHSGSGKTTILRQIIREELPTKGKIFFQDQEITKMKRSGIYQLRREIGTIFQDYKLIDDKNAYENVSFALEAAGVSSKEIKETVPYVLDIVNLSGKQKAFPDELSGGEKQRVAIARAIVNNPKVLIADEPTGNLDPDSAWDVVQVLDKINKWGTTVIMSTHGSEIVNTMQKRVLKMEKGKLVRDEKKGGYTEADEFALKILGKEKKNAKKVSTEPAIKKEQKKTKGEKKIDAIIHKADTAGLEILGLSKALVKKLTEAKYSDVEDILVAGIGKVNEKLNGKEVRELAKAIKKFVTTE